MAGLVPWTCLCTESPSCFGDHFLKNDSFLHISESLLGLRSQGLASLLRGGGGVGGRVPDSSVVKLITNIEMDRLLEAH